MASRFWVGGTGTWDSSDQTHWAASSNGAGGQTVPGASDIVTFDGSSGGGTITLGYSPTVTSITMGAFTGTFDASTFSPTMTTFSCTGLGTRTILMGTGTWTLTGNNTTIFNGATTTNLSLTRGNAIQCTYNLGVGTRTLSCSATESLTFDFAITAGTDIISISRCHNLDFTGFSGSLVNETRSIFGNLTLSSTMTVTDGATVTAFASTSGTNTITSNTAVFNVTTSFNGVGGTWQLADAINTGTRGLSIAAGTLTTNGYTLTSLTFTASGSTTCVMNLGASVWTLTGTGTPWNNVATALTITGTSTIKFTDATSSGKTFAGGGITYYNLYFTGAGTGIFTISGSNTFHDLKCDTPPHTIKFTVGTTNTFTTFTVNGTSGNLMTINSTTTGTFTLVNAGSAYIICDYVSLQHSIATPATNWYAGFHSTNNQSVATVGSGWTFSSGLPLRNTTSYSNQSKNTTSFSNRTKVASAWSNQTKN